MENKFDGSRMTATEVCMMQDHKDSVIQSITSSLAYGLGMYKIAPAYFWKDIKLDKKKKISLQQSVDDCHLRLNCFLKGNAEVQMRISKVECQELPGMKAQHRGLVDEVNSLRGCVKHNAEALEKRVLALEQTHCDHDYEIVGGRVSFAACQDILDPVLHLKCTKCGKTEVRELTPAKEPEPKRSWWYRFKVWAAPTSFGVE